VKLKVLEELEPSTIAPLPLLVEPGVNVPACVLKLLASREFS
jgi:hypothetical protein